MLLHSIDTLAPAIVEVFTDRSTGNRSLISKVSFSAGDPISSFYWSHVYPSPTYLTIQLGEEEHISLLPSCLACVNHSCHPNAFFDIDQKQLVCIRPISCGEEILFFYPSSEWSMDQPFTCLCKSPHCLHTIAGAKYLTPVEQKRYRFTSFIQKKLASVYGLTS
ncbi:MAG: SET domain-containing protein-lysine N-methyltransferase [Williamsia sp.]|nr:SET domain-containing protein-lysine N-methyltransferase [Williamsia sp.]